MRTPDRRHSLVIILITVAITSFFIAMGTTRLLAHSLMPLSSAASEGTTRAETSTHPPDADSMRRLFGTPPPRALPVAESPTTVDATAVPCAGNYRLVGAVVADSRPTRSYAAIASSDGSVSLYRTGEQVDHLELMAIRPRDVSLKTESGAICHLDMSADASAFTTTPAAAPPLTDDTDIVRVSELSYRVSRSFVTSLLARTSDLMSEARLVVHEGGGGVELRGMRPQGVLSRLGLRNGDVLRTINGYDCSSPDAMLEAYAHLRNATHLSVSFVRGDVARTMAYTVQ